MALSGKRTEDITLQYYDDIYRFAVSRCRDKETAKDVTQQTFWELARQADSLVDENIRAWLYTTANNVMRSLFREQGREAAFVSIEEIGDAPDLPEPDCEVPDASDESLDLVERRILALLTEEEQKTFLELFIRRKNVRIYAYEQGISEAAARSRKSRLKKKALELYRHTYFLYLVIFFKIFS